MGSSTISPEGQEQAVNPPKARGGEFWTREDWWAVWLGLGTVALASALFLRGSGISWIAVAPAKWSTLSQLGANFASNLWRYAAQFAAFVAAFSLATSFI